MKGYKPGKAVIYIVFTLTYMLLAQSCFLQKKKCGCVGDINGVYKHKRYN